MYRSHSPDILLSSLVSQLTWCPSNLLQKSCQQHRHIFVFWIISNGKLVGEAAHLSIDTYAISQFSRSFTLSTVTVYCSVVTPVIVRQSVLSTVRLTFSSVAVSPSSGSLTVTSSDNGVPVLYITSVPPSTVKVGGLFAAINGNHEKALHCETNYVQQMDH